MSYLNIAEVETAIANLASAYPAITKLISLPHSSFEGRNCHALQVGAGAPGTRDCVMVIGGVHAREWGSCEIAVNFCADLLEAYSLNTGLAYGGMSFTASQIQGLVNTLHLVVFPLVNPDGRLYSQTIDQISTDAGWRRNRNPANSGGQPKCIGVDIYRNYDFPFDFQAAFSPASAGSIYTSADPCNTSQVYHGPAPFSEPETLNVKWLLDAYPRTRWFLDVHSYAEDILFNWGDDENQSSNPGMNFRNSAFNAQRGVNSDAAYKEFIPSDDLAIAQELAFRFRDGLKAVRGKTYTAKQAFHLYPTAGASDDYVYARHFVDPSKGKVYGYTIEWGTEFRPAWAEMELIVQDVTAGLINFCLAAPCGGGVAAISLATPVVTFNDIPAGIETSRAVVFSVQSCGAVDLQVTSGPSVTSGPGSFHLPMGGASLPGASSNAQRDARVWVSFRGTNPGDVTHGSMTVHCPQTNQDFVIPIVANTIAQPIVASVVVLDKSGSMDFASGIPGQRRIDVLHSAAPNFATLLPDNDAIGIVSFDQDSHPGMGITTAGPLGTGLGRVGATSAIAAHATNPAGLTAIGDGVELAHNVLLPVTGFDQKAIVVFTDGQETASKYIADIAGLITDRVFAIGLGTVQEVNPIALNRLVNNTGGYLLMTDALGPADIFRLSKYFVQILAGVTNAEIVVDPEGVVPQGITVRIPFDLHESDYACDTIVLSPSPWAVDFALETPAGTMFDQAMLGGSVAGARYVSSSSLSFFRLNLPVLVNGAEAFRGRWHAVLRVRDSAWKEYLAMEHRKGGKGGGSAIGVPYSVVVHARSSLNMSAGITQSTYEPGALLNLRVVLSEIGLPVQKRAKVTAEIRLPDGTVQSNELPEAGPGTFEGALKGNLSGVYTIRFLASGTTLRGSRFTREQLRTATVWSGGDDSPPKTETTQPPTDQRWCDLIRCLLDDKGIQRWLMGHDINPASFEKCLENSICRKR